MNETERLPIVIELAKVEDAKEMVEVHAQSWLETYPNNALGITEEIVRNSIFGEQNEKIADRIERYARRIETKDEHNHSAFVARQDNKIVGLSLPYVEPGGRHRLGAFYVLESAWGQGVGSQLLSKALDWHGSNDVYLLVATYNERAIRFYEKHGFHRTGAESEEIFTKDVKMPEFEMVHQSDSDKSISSK